MRPPDFGFVTNATEGVNVVLRSLALRAGDELLTTTHVYNAVRQAMKHTAGRAGAGYREVEVPLPVESAGQIASIVLNALSPRTRLLVIDHVTSPTALVFPVEQIVAECARIGVDVLVDGAHAPGMLPLDVPKLGAAYYAGNLHKWVCGPKGSGFLWVRPDRQAEIHPLVISHYLGQGFAREFEWQGTRDYSAWLAVPKAIEFLAGFGWDRVRAFNHALASWAHAMLAARWDVAPLSPIDGRMLGSMFSLPLPRRLAPEGALPEAKVMELQRHLYEREQIEVPIMGWSGRNLIRPCCQIYNRAEDYERLATAIERL